MIEKGLADLFLKPLTPLIDSVRLQATGAVSNQDYFLGHALKEPGLTVKQQRMQLFHCFDLSFIALTLATILSFFVVSKLFLYAYERSQRNVTLLSMLKFRQDDGDFVRRLTGYGLTVFLFFVIILWSNNIKVSYRISRLGETKKKRRF